MKQVNACKKATPKAFKMGPEPFSPGRYHTFTPRRKPYEKSGIAGNGSCTGAVFVRSPAHLPKNWWWSKTALRAPWIPWARMRTPTSLSWPTFSTPCCPGPVKPGLLLPGLAVKYERLGANSWKFYLRQGGKFHNGNPFTAEDVAYTFQRPGGPQGE